MYFTSGQDRAFERLMQEKPGFDHYDGGGANAPEDCGSCRLYRPDWKYQYCVYAECPYQPGKLTALAAVKFTVKGADDDMAVFRVEKNKGYTVMSNHHLRNKALSLKAKGLLSQISANGSYRKMNKDGKAWTARLSHVVYRMTPTTLEKPYLNPDWVEWLMGFPRKGTDIPFGQKNPPTSRV